MDSILELKTGMKELSAEQLDDFEEAFSLLKNPRTETLPLQNLDLLLRLIGLNPTDGAGSDIASVFKKQKCKDNVSYQQALLIAKRAKFATPTYSDLLAIAKAFDSDGDGYLTVLEVRKILFNSGEMLNEVDLHDIMEECGGTHLEKLKIEDFVRATYNYEDAE